jgi:hypothetical protein
MDPQSHRERCAGGLPFPRLSAETQRLFNGGFCFRCIRETAKYIESVTGRIRMCAIVRNPSLCGDQNMAEMPLGAGQRAHTLGLIPDGAMNWRLVCLGKRPGFRIAGRVGKDHMRMLKNRAFDIQER